MKPLTIILIILYLSLFGLGGWWFYRHYLNDVIHPEQKSQSVIRPEQSIFYTKADHLYQLNANLLNAGSSAATKGQIPSNGQISEMVLAKDSQLLFYQTVTGQNVDEIWQLNLSDSQSEKLFSALTPGLENFTAFRDPKLSFDQKDLAFLATHNGIDNIFTYDIKSRTLTNLTDSLYQGKISDFSWTNSDLSIYFSTLSAEQTQVKLVDLNKKIQNLWSGTPKINQMTAIKERLIILYQNAALVNLGYFDLSAPGQIKPITDLAGTKIVSRFNVSADGANIVYQVTETTAQTSDLYTAATDGTNLLQLTTNGKSLYPVFSPDGAKIAYWLKDSGIFTVQTGLRPGIGVVFNHNR